MKCLLTICKQTEYIKLGILYSYLSNMVLGIPLRFFSLLLLACLSSAISKGQQVEEFQQFNGQFDYLAFGNTLNLAENTTPDTPDPPCAILTSSSADFELQPGQNVVAAYLYWAGSGAGDFQVTLNGNQITAERTFSDSLTDVLVYFAAYADVTDIVSTTGNGNYTLADLDLTQVIAQYCGNTTNFGGWAITVIYEDATLPLNQVTLFDGLQSVSATNNFLTINLNNINVLDNVGAKIGFLAWEGDASLDIMETLQINGNIISNPPLNPANNAFNSTNSFTNNAMLYNMDIDSYSIENNIQPGDTSAVIDLTSGQDFVMINNVITVLNSELPDATIDFGNVTGATECGNRTIDIDYTVFNNNCTDVLPSETPIAFYANTTLIAQAATLAEIAIDGQESGAITVTIPPQIPADFQFQAFVDDTGDGTGIVNEINEDNNGVFIDFSLLELPDISGLEDLEICDAVGIEIFDLNEAIENIDPTLILTFHMSEMDAIADTAPIDFPETYINTTNPEEIFIRADNGICQTIDSFMVEVLICPLPDATITIDNNLNACRRRDLNIEYTVYNTLGTAPLPANTPIAFYISGQFFALSATENILPVNGSELGTIEIILSESVADTFSLTAIADDNGTQNGIVEELDETNNTFNTSVIFQEIPPIRDLPDLVACDLGFNMAFFDLTQQDDLIATNPEDTVSYFTSPVAAVENSNPIADPENYQNGSNPQAIFVRLENEICFTTTNFLIRTENCPPIIPQGFSPNGDSINDEFEITGLLDVYENFILKIFSREGNLIYEGGNDLGFWKGIPNAGILYKERLVPTGTYYYVLFLNDPQLPKPYTGFVYINY